MSGIRDRRGTSGTPRAHRASLRFPLALPLLIALLTLAVLWGYAGTGMTSDALDQRADADRVGTAGESLHPLVSALQEERLHTATWLGAQDDATREELDTARDRTDETVEAFHATPRAEVAAGSDTAARRGAELNGALNDLVELRDSVDAGGSDGIETYTGYTDVVAESTALLTVVGQVDSADTARGAAAVAELVRLGEGLSQGEALLRLAEAEADGADVAVWFAHALATQRDARAALAADALPAEEAAAYTRLTESERWEVLTAPEPGATSGADPLPASPTAWADAAHEVGEELTALAADGRDAVTAEAAADANRTLWTVAIGTLVALGALAGSAVLGHRAWRSLSSRMADLERDTRALTDQRLPELTEQLQRAKPEIPDLPTRPDTPGDELDRVAAATEHQWRALVETLISQARGRAGTETVLLGLARRTQSLINRMIPKLDKLEREHQDSRLLKDIFVVDHLATRMRRHTENLLILGGSLPARRWGKPVPVYEVVRSAISETEDYSRVEAMPGPAVSLTGRAVADVSHLLAELIENGASFSPPETKVTVSAETVAKGRLAIEVVDRGLSMPAAEYDRLNLLLADPPRLDIAELGTSPRLGLLVVARLAKRHGLEVVLRRSPYGGTLAVVLLPSELLEQSKPLLPDLMSRGTWTDAESRREAAEPRREVVDSRREVVEPRREVVEPRRDVAASSPALEAAPAAPPWGDSANPAASASAFPVRGAPAGPAAEAPTAPMAEAPAAPTAEVPAVSATQTPAATMHAALIGATRGWIGDDGSGYPAYSGAGLLPPDTGERLDPAFESGPAPERFPSPESLAGSDGFAGAEGFANSESFAGSEGRAGAESFAGSEGFASSGRFPSSPTPAAPDASPPALSPMGGLPMVTGGGLLPPDDESGAASAALPTTGAPDTPHAPDMSHAPGAPYDPDLPRLPAPPNAAASPDDPDIAYTREVPLPPHAEEARPAPGAAPSSADHGALGTASSELIVGGDTPLALPVRVRGENLADGLRTEQPPLTSADKGRTDTAPSPERAARTVGAIQWGNRRARAAADAHAAAGHDQGAEPGHPTGSDEPARKDQR